MQTYKVLGSYFLGIAEDNKRRIAFEHYVGNAVAVLLTPSAVTKEHIRLNIVGLYRHLTLADSEVDVGTEFREWVSDKVEDPDYCVPYVYIYAMLGIALAHNYGLDGLLRCYVDTRKLHKDTVDIDAIKPRLQKAFDSFWTEVGHNTAAQQCPKHSPLGYMIMANALHSCKVFAPVSA